MQTILVLQEGSICKKKRILSSQMKCIKFGAGFIETVDTTKKRMQEKNWNMWEKVRKEILLCQNFRCVAKLDSSHLYKLYEIHLYYDKNI